MNPPPPVLSEASTGFSAATNSCAGTMRRSSPLRLEAGFEHRGGLRLCLLVATPMLPERHEDTGGGPTLSAMKAPSFSLFQLLEVLRERGTGFLDSSTQNGGSKSSEAASLDPSSLASGSKFSMKTHLCQLATSEPSSPRSSCCFPGSFFKPVMLSLLHHLRVVSADWQTFTEVGHMQRCNAKAHKSAMQGAQRPKTRVKRPTSQTCARSAPARTVRRNRSKT